MSQCTYLAAVATSPFLRLLTVGERDKPRAIRLAPLLSLSLFLCLVLSFPRRRHPNLGGSSPRRTSSLLSIFTRSLLPTGLRLFGRRDAVALLMADGATTATLLVAHGGRRRSGRGGLLLMLLLYPLHLSAAAPESECAKFAGPRAHLRWLRFIRPVPRCVRRVASSCATPAPPPPTTPLRMPLQHPRAIVGSLRPAPPLPGAGCSSPRAPSRSQEADMYGGSTSLVPSIPSGDAHPLFSNVSVIYSLASSLPQVRRGGCSYAHLFLRLQMRPPVVCINAQGGLLWRGQHVCLKERDGKEGAGVREEEGVEPHVISLSSTSSHHYRDFLG